MGRSKGSIRKRKADNNNPSSDRPLKKRNGVTAGIAQAADPEPNHVGSARNDDSSVS